MAIYHFSAQMISRGKGQSAVASAAYRSGERLEDERTGEVKFYKREVQPEAMILAPSNSPKWVQDRQRLWNEVEKSETRKNSQLAREANIALPRELSHDQQRELIRDYVQEQFVNKGMIADVAIHRDDKENPHAHVMLTTREISKDGFGKKNREWNDRKQLEQWREQWSEFANRSLEKEGVQERISHLSHKARGLEQLPTVHLGYVAHEMEKRGVETERGNINRERQEYNQLVVDLQKYREEKQALEQEMTRKQQQKQQIKRLFTPQERVQLQEASKLLKANPTLSKVNERVQQLDKWEKRLDTNYQYLNWKSQSFKEAGEHYTWIDSFKHRIQEEQQKIENINWLNPLKLKENRSLKEQAENKIERLQNDIKSHDEKLNYYREKLDFKDEKEFKNKENQFQSEQPIAMEQNKKQRRQLKNERDTLQKAEQVIQRGFVRQLASNYPERPEMAYMSFSDAQKLHQLNENQGKVVPVENIEKFVTTRKQEIQRLQNEISRVDQYYSRLQRAESYLQNYEKHQAIVEKYENNPFLKGKMLVSKSAKQEYDNAVTARNNYHDYMKKEGISGRIDLEKQTDILSKMEAKVPEFKGQIQSQEKGMGLLNAILKGVEQAGREMQIAQKRQQQQAKGKNRGKKRTHTWEIDR